MESRYELISGSLASMYHDIQKIERMEMAKYGLKGPHAQCLLAMKRHPEGITAARICEACERTKLPFPGSSRSWKRPEWLCGKTETVPVTGPVCC